MIRRGEVWISPQGWVPPGRLIDPDSAELGASWQDDDLLEDEVFRGAAAAVEWGRQRSDVVMIRLGHHDGSYFSAGERHPADAEGVPHWPPAAPPPEGWWSPPPLPTLEDVQARSDGLERSETDQTETRAWAEEQLAIFGHDLDVPTQKALVDLSDGGERPRFVTVVRAVELTGAAADRRSAPSWHELRDRWTEDRGAAVEIYVRGTTAADWQHALDLLTPPWPAIYTEHGRPAARPARVEEIFRRRERTPELRIELTPLIALKAHFASPDEIELEFDPEELLNEADAGELLRLVRVLAHGLSRIVHVDTEPGHRSGRDALSYDPSSDRFER